MSRYLSRILLFCIGSLLTAASMVAQQGARCDIDHPPSFPPIICGTSVFNDGGEQKALEKTARENPELYRHMIERSRRREGAGILSDEDIWTFTVRNRIDGRLEFVNAALRFQGKRARIWVDVKDTARITKRTLEAFARGLDTATPGRSRDSTKGIIENDIDVFGAPPPNRFDPGAPDIQDFLFTDIKDSMEGGNVLGFFSPWDQTNNDGSNRMNLLYIDSREGLRDQMPSDINRVLSTLAHEFQHLIHYRTNRQSETFYNEGCSEVASTICGYKDRLNSGFFSNTNIPLLRWSDGDVYSDIENDYQRAMTFFRYLYEQYGESFLTKFAGAQSTGMARIAEALQGIGREPDWRTALKGFVVANYVISGPSDHRYTYQMTFSSGRAKATNTYSGDFPLGGSNSVQAYASIYNVYNFTPSGGIRARFQAGEPIAAMAICYRGSQVIEVREMANDEEHAFGETTGYDRIIFAVANLAGIPQTVKWTVERITSGVDDEIAANGGLSVTGVVPNPASEEAIVRFTMPARGSATLALYDVAGRLVRTIIQEERLEGGNHEISVKTGDLPTNVYMLRLTHDSRSVGRALVVVR